MLPAVLDYAISFFVVLDVLLTELRVSVVVFLTVAYSPVNVHPTGFSAFMKPVVDALICGAFGDRTYS